MDMPGLKQDKLPPGIKLHGPFKPVVCACKACEASLYSGTHVPDAATKQIEAACSISYQLCSVCHISASALASGLANTLNV